MPPTEEKGPDNVDLKSLRLPLIVDSALLLIIIFQSGVAWNQIGELRDDVAALRDQMQRTQQAQPASVERLARIEEGISWLRTDIGNLRDELHGWRKK
mgnify:CR=1 FL=1